MVEIEDLQTVEEQKPDNCPECGRDLRQREFGRPTAFEGTEPAGPTHERDCHIHGAVHREY